MGGAGFWAVGTCKYTESLVFSKFSATMTKLVYRVAVVLKQLEEVQDLHGPCSTNSYFSAVGIGLTTLTFSETFLTCTIGDNFSLLMTTPRLSLLCHLTIWWRILFHFKMPSVTPCTSNSKCFLLVNVHNDFLKSSAPGKIHKYTRQT